MAKKKLLKYQIPALQQLETDEKYSRRGGGLQHKNETEIEKDISYLVKFCEKRIIQETSDAKNVPLYFGATAGLRILKCEKRNRLLNIVKKSIRDTKNYINNDIKFFIDFKDKNDYHDKDHSIQILNGKKEGFYGWVTVNYLTGILLYNEINDENNVLPTYGAIDMGGSSLEITFDLNNYKDKKDEILSNIEDIDVDTTIGKKKYNLYTHCYETFGNDDLRNGYLKFIVDNAEEVNGVKDGEYLKYFKKDIGNKVYKYYSPCFDYGYVFKYRVNKKEKEITYIFMDGAKVYDNEGAKPDIFKSCLKTVEEYLEIKRKYQGETETDCSKYEKTALNGACSPEIDGKTTFYLFSSFNYMAMDTGIERGEKISIEDMKNKIIDTCKMTEKEARIKYNKDEKKELNDKKQAICFSGSIQYKILKELGFKETDKNIIITDSIKSKDDKINRVLDGKYGKQLQYKTISGDLSWTTGAMAYEIGILPFKYNN
jgi:Golgi nucleoside diphosphatase